MRGAAGGRSISAGLRGLHGRFQFRIKDTAEPCGPWTLKGRVLLGAWMARWKQAWGPGHAGAGHRPSTQPCRTEKRCALTRLLPALCGSPGQCSHQAEEVIPKAPGRAASSSQPPPSTWHHPRRRQPLPCLNATWELPRRTPHPP